jgi:hypothetical protein
MISETLVSIVFQADIFKCLPVAGLKEIYNCSAKSKIKLFFCTLNAQAASRSGKR